MRRAFSCEAPNLNTFKIEKRPPVLTPRVAILLVVAVYALTPFNLVLADEEPPKSKEIQYASPQDVFASYRKALDKKDWRTVFLCHSPEERAMLLLEGTMLSYIRGSDRASQELLKQYGATEDAVLTELRKRYRIKNGRDFKLPITADSQGELVQRSKERPYGVLPDVYAALIADGSEFFAAAHRFDQDHDSRERYGELTDASIKGDSATGRSGQYYSSGKRDSNVQVMTIHFKKLNGSWFIANKAPVPGEFVPTPPVEAIK